MKRNVLARFFITWLLLCGCFALPLAGATIQVTTTLDHVPGSLRDAINIANSSNGEITILVPAGTFILSGEPDEDANLGGDLDINTNGKITIKGDEPSGTFIDGNMSDRVFHIMKGTIVLEHIAVVNGYPQTKDFNCASNTERDYLPQHGGGIYNAATLTLNNCTIANNHGKNGGFFCRQGSWYGTDGSHGGGIFNGSTLVINHCRIRRNTAGARGFDGLSNEMAGDGGGIFNAGTITIDSSDLDQNQTEAGGNGAGIYNNGTLIIRTSLVYDNTTAAGTGCRHCEYGLPSGSGAGILNAQGTATITDCTIRDNKTGTAGMGDMSWGYSGSGGGIYNSGHMTLTRTAIYNNATGKGNTLFFNVENRIGGGGLYNEATGQLTLINCTVSGNATGNGIADMDDNERGGYGAGILNDQGVLTLINCTVASNRTGQPSQGADRGGSGGGIYNETGGTCTLTNTILADNAVSPNQEGPDGHGTFISNGYNLVENTAHLTLTGSTATDITGQDPMLLPLAENGGQRVTHALKMSSPALDKGYSPTYHTDQREYTRPFDISTVTNAKDGSDIGAYELNTPYYISGRIKANNIAVAGVRLVFHDAQGGGFHDCFTDSSGYYLQPVEAGWSGYAIPIQENYTFTPWKKDFAPIGASLSGQDFTAIPNTLHVTITSPQNQAIVGGNVPIYASLSATPGVSPDTNYRVTFYINGAYVAVDNSAPFEYLWNTATFFEGTYTIKAVAQNNAGQIAQHQITVTLSHANRIVLSRTEVEMNYYIGGASVPDQAFTISNGGGGQLEWTLKTDSDWFYCSAHSGLNAHPIHIYVDMNRSYAPGTYTGTITISALDSINSPQTVTVRLRVYNGSSQAPFGSFETPADNASVSSSVPLTGWALDDLGITAVKIYRAPVAGEDNALVYIGEANLVPGARPDIQTAYPGYPNNHKAGWGYMLLTHFLPEGGNGTFTFYAVASDAEGNETTLGSKTFTSDNLHATKPFGAIDTPSQGGTVLSRFGQYTNFGWALTPMPNMIPVDGGYITVWIDGVAVGSPVYNKYRQDIATLFPGYANSQGAVGYFTMDTTVLKDGVHTMAWSVTDNAHNTDGIGSRYFTIYSGYDQNASASAHLPSPPAIDTIPLAEPQPLKWSTGFTSHESSEVFTPATPNQKGHIHLQIQETEPLVIHFGPDFVPNQGYLQVGDQFLPLPIGSILKQKEGAFHWLPGPGFIGNYELLFIGTTPSGAFSKQYIRINITPKF